MKLFLTLIEDQRCQDCGKVGWVADKSLLCLRCLAPIIEKQSRQAKKEKDIATALREKFSEIGRDVARKIFEFNAAGNTPKIAP